MKKNRIFLSYRRDDSPGYVSRLEYELERAFGQGRVFRDATDIPGGTKWKNVIDANLHSSAALLLIIGPRWEEIWLERINDEVNYVALELQRARELDVPIIPVTLDGTQLSKGLDLGSINFIYENQFHDISDRQGRWHGDLQRLVSLLESVPGMGLASTDDAAPPEPENSNRRSRFKWFAAIAGILIVAAIWLGSGVGPNQSADESDLRISATFSDNAQGRTVAVQGSTAAAQPAAATTVAQNASTGSQPSPAVVQSASPVAAPLPDIGGTWQGKDGTVYFVQQNDDGTFDVQSPGYGNGQGRFFTNMPRKFEIEMFGIGRGEFSVSVTDDKAMGWIVIDGQQQYDTLIRIE